jgi:HPt (histidine-containing phosphotransfer) domain-containing protein
MQEIIERIRLALDQGNDTELERGIHAMKGVLLNSGLQDLGAEATILNQQAKAGMHAMQVRADAGAFADRISASIKPE